MTRKNAVHYFEIPLFVPEIFQAGLVWRFVFFLVSFFFFLYIMP